MSEDFEKDQDKNSELRSCKLCGSKISPYTPFCRECGHPQGSILALWVMVAFFILLLAMYIGMSVFCMCHAHEYRVYTEPHPNGKQKRGMDWPGRNSPESENDVEK